VKRLNVGQRIDVSTFNAMVAKHASVLIVISSQQLHVESSLPERLIGPTLVSRELAKQDPSSLEVIKNNIDIGWCNPSRQKLSPCGMIVTLSIQSLIPDSTTRNH
jgi:hypothetical protein